MDGPDGVTAAAQRVSQIQAQLASLQRPSARSHSFAQMLQSAAPNAPAVAAAAATLTTPSATWARTSTLTPRLATTSTTGPDGSGAAAAGSSLGPGGVPRDLAQYGNGQIPASALSPVGNGRHRLWAPAAAAFQRLQAAAGAAGVRIGVTDSYRSYDEQVELAARKGLYSAGGLAARPGTSQHGWGRSLDLDLDDRAQAWMRTHAAQFGFAENVAREPWHWTFSPQP